MSDDLKDSLKNLEKYVQEESKQKKKEQKKFERELRTGAFRVQRTFPLNKLIFFSMVMSVTFFGFGKNLKPFVTKYAPKPVSDTYDTALKITEDYTNQIEQFRTSKTKTITTKSTDQALSAAEIEGTQAAPTTNESQTRAVAAQANNEPQWVQIDRKWYKKTADNIYYVNGKKVLFIENRQRDLPNSKIDGTANTTAAQK